MPLFSALLPTRTVITLHGPDVRRLLQGIITQNIDALSPDNALFAALLSPQGKWLHDFFMVTPEPETVWLETDAENSTQLIERLKRYRLRAKVEIALLENAVVMAQWGEDLPPASKEKGALWLIDPRYDALGRRGIFLPDTAMPEQNATVEDYNRMRIGLGIPHGLVDIGSEGGFILDYGYDLLHAVDFAKGCYVGQEVTARMHYKGNRKKKLYCVTASVALPAPGTALTSGDGQAIGALTSVSGPYGLVLCRREEAQNIITKKEPIVAGNAEVTLSSPPWWQE